MRRRPYLIAVEGLDAAGKTTLAALLARTLHAEPITTPPAELRQVRRKVDGVFAREGLAWQLFYASTVAYASARARRALAAGRDIVIDRYWLSTCVNDALRPGSVRLTAVQRVLFRPTHTVLLEVDERERRRRLRVRGATSADRDTLPHAERLRALYRRKARGPFSGRVVMLDTSTTPPGACLERVLAVLP